MNDTFEFSINDETIVMRIVNGSLVAEGYDFENEQLAAELVNYYSPITLFLLGAQALFKECGEEEFRYQYKAMLQEIKNPEASESNGDLCLLLQHCKGEDVWSFLGHTSYFGVLAHSPFPWVRQRIAADERTDKNTVLYLLQDRDEDVKCSAISNSNLPYDELLRFADLFQYRRAAMLNPQAKNELHRENIKSWNRSVKAAIAMTTDCPVIMDLLKDEEYTIVRHLICKPNLPRYLLLYFRLSQNPWVRGEVIEIQDQMRVLQRVAFKVQLLGKYLSRITGWYW